MSEGIYRCHLCKKRSNRQVYIGADRFFPRAVGGAIMMITSDKEMEAFCSVPCLLAYHGDKR